MEPGPAHRRRRPAVACSECRRRKIRCDRASPCGPCSKSLPMLRCVYQNKTGYGDQQMPKHYHHYHSQQQQPQTDPESPPARPGYHRSESSNSIDGLNSPLLDETMTIDSEAFTNLDHVGFNWDTSGFHHAKSPSILLSDTYVLSQSPSSTTKRPRLPPTENGSQLRLFQRRPERMFFSSDTATSGQDSGPEGVQHGMELGLSDGDNCWYGKLARLEKLRFIVQNISRNENSYSGEEASPVPERDMLQPLFNEVINLSKVVQLQHEQANKTLGRVPPLPRSPTPIQNALPSRHTCNTLLSSYLETFESVLRVLDTPTFLSDYDHFWARRSSSTLSSADTNEPFVYKLLVIIALGSSISLNTQTSSTEGEYTRQTLRQNQANMWVDQTRQWLAHKTAMGVRANLDIAQIACLLALARYTDLDTNLSVASKRDGAARLSKDHDLARLGIQMGLHREPRIRSPTMPAKEAEIRRRLWATMLELSMQQYLDEGLPPPLNPETYDCEAPSNIEDDHLDMMGFVPTSQAATSSTIIVVLARTQRLRLRILHRVNAPGASKTWEEIHRLAAELSKTCNVELEALLSTGMTQPTNFQIWLLNLFTRPFILALLETFADHAMSTRTSYYSRRMRMDVSALLLPRVHDNSAPLTQSWATSHANQTNTTGQKAVRYLSLPTPTSSSPSSINAQQGHHESSCTALYIHGRGYFSVIQRQVTATLFADLLAELEDDAFPNLDRASFRQLSAVLRETVNVYQMRVRTSGGVHSCREFVLFASAQAYVDALMKRSAACNIQEAIAKSARMALSFCCKVMRLRGQPALERNFGVEAAKSSDVQAFVAAKEDIQIWMQNNILENDVQELDIRADDSAVKGFQNLDIWAFDDPSLNAESYLYFPGGD